MRATELRGLFRDAIQRYSASYLDCQNSNEIDAIYDYDSTGDGIIINGNNTFLLSGVVKIRVDKSLMNRINKLIEPAINELKLAIDDYNINFSDNSPLRRKLMFTASKLDILDNILSRNVNYFSSLLYSRIYCEIENYDKTDRHVYDVVDKTSLYSSYAKYEYHKTKYEFDLAFNDKDDILKQMEMHSIFLNTIKQDSINFVRPVNFRLLDNDSKGTSSKKTRQRANSFSEMIKQALEVFEKERQLAKSLYGETAAEKNAREALLDALIKEEEQEKSHNSKARLQKQRSKNSKTQDSLPKPTRKDKEKVPDNIDESLQAHTQVSSPILREIKIDWRIKRWNKRKNEDDSALIERILRFKNKGDNYALLKTNEVLLEWKKHNLSGLEQMLIFPNYQGQYYFKTKNNGFSCFAQLVLAKSDGDEEVINGNIDFGIDENNVVYHMYFKETAARNRTLEEIQRPKFENVFTNCEQEENLSTWDDVGSTSLREESGALIFRVSGCSYYYKILSKPK